MLSCKRENIETVGLTWLKGSVGAPGYERAVPIVKFIKSMKEKGKSKIETNE